MFTTFLNSMWSTAVELAPSLFLGLLVAGVLHVLVKREAISRHLGKPGFASTFKAAALGVPLPLCSCGVLPAALALKKDGASRGATVSFLASTPQTGVDSIAATWGMLGWPVALAKMIAALIAGVVSGTLVDHSRDDSAEQVSRPTCVPTERGPALIRAFRYSFNTILGDIWAFLLAGVAVSALIFTFVPPGSLADHAALNGPLGLLAALAVGIPLYVCSVSSVPVAAAMVYAGFPVGAALVFLMAGPATNFATIGAVRKALGRNAFLSYLITLIVVSLAAGLLLNSVSIPGVRVSGEHHIGGVPLWKNIAAGVFYGALGFHAFKTLKGRVRTMTAHSGNATVEMKVIGMTCGNCVRHVEEALAKLAGVRAVKVVLDPGKALIEPGDGFSACAALAAVRAEGYEASIGGSSCGCDS
ncbi:MAG: permease [Candidatus Fermentibacteraceae bacterium]